MRKTISLWMLGIMAMLASCSQNEDVLQNATTDGETAQVKISVQAPQQPVQTRADVSSALTRYVCEVYEGANATGTVSKHYESATGSFAVELKKNTAYSFLFWADKGTPASGETPSSGKYNVANLKAVSMTEGGEEGYSGSILNKTITATDNEGLSVTLKHAVARITIENTIDLTDATGNKLTVTYPQTVTFNVGTEGITNTDTPVSRTFDVAQAKGVVVNDYVFAPKEEAQLSNLKLKLNEEAEKTIANIPVQLNYITRIKGALSKYYNSTFSVSSSVYDFGSTSLNPIN